MTILLRLLVTSLLVSVTPSSATPTHAPSPRTRDVSIAIEEMQRANYLAFAMLINLSPPHLFRVNLTFLIPTDRSLTTNSLLVYGTSVPSFLTRHAIPSPLAFHDLRHLPSGSLLPTFDRSTSLILKNSGPHRFFIGNARVVGPNICSERTSIRCHGIDAVLLKASKQITTSNCSVPAGPAANVPPPPSQAIGPDSTPPARTLEGSGGSGQLLLCWRAFVTVAAMFQLTLNSIQL